MHRRRKVICYLAMPLWGGLEDYQRGVTLTNVFLDENGKQNLESICMEDQGHIFTFDLFFLGQCAMPKGPAFNEQYFSVVCDYHHKVELYTIRACMHVCLADT